MTDRNLVELAAKAAGYVISWHHANQCYMIIEGVSERNWRPRQDDGDALRLACAIAKHTPCGVTALSVGPQRSGCEFSFVEGPDILANTRLAIFRAAVVIGRGLPETLEANE